MDREQSDERDEGAAGPRRSSMLTRLLRRLFPERALAKPDGQAAAASPYRRAARRAASMSHLSADVDRVLWVEREVRGPYRLMALWHVGRTPRELVELRRGPPARRDLPECLGFPGLVERAGAGSPRPWRRCCSPAATASSVRASCTPVAAPRSSTIPR